MLENFESHQEQKEGEVTFRDLKLEDLDDMVNVINSLKDEGIPMINEKKITPEEWLPQLKESLEKIEKGEDICVAAEAGGHLVGWYALRKVEKTEIQPPMD